MTSYNTSVSDNVDEYDPNISKTLYFIWIGTNGVVLPFLLIISSYGHWYHDIHRQMLTILFGYIISYGVFTIWFTSSLIFFVLTNVNTVNTTQLKMIFSIDIILGIMEFIALVLIVYPILRILVIHHRIEHFIDRGESRKLGEYLGTINSQINSSVMNTAIIKGNPECLRVLCEYQIGKPNFNPNHLIKNTHNIECFCVLIRYLSPNEIGEIVVNLVKEDKTDYLDRLLQIFPHYTKHRDVYGVPLLLRAKTPDCVKVLAKFGVNPSEMNTLVKCNNIWAIETILKSKCVDVNTVNESDGTFLHSAKSPECVHMLLTHGADPCIVHDRNIAVKYWFFAWKPYNLSYELMVETYLSFPECRKPASLDGLMDIFWGVENLKMYERFAYVVIKSGSDMPSRCREHDDIKTRIVEKISKEEARALIRNSVTRILSHNETKSFSDPNVWKYIIDLVMDEENPCL